MSKFTQLVWSTLTGALGASLVIGVSHIYGGATTADHSAIASSQQAAPSISNGVNSANNRPLMTPTSPSAHTSDNSTHSEETQSFSSQSSQSEFNPHSEVDRLRMSQDMGVKHDQALYAHSRESRDNNWAGRMESRLQDAFRSPPSGATIHLEQTDCRSRTCTVVLQWPSRDAAQQELQLPSQLVAQIPCADRIVLPAGMPSETQFQATLLLDCTGHQTEAIN